MIVNKKVDKNRYSEIIEAGDPCAHQIVVVDENDNMLSKVWSFNNDTKEVIFIVVDETDRKKLKYEDGKQVFKSIIMPGARLMFRRNSDHGCLAKMVEEGKAIIQSEDGTQKGN